MKFQYLIATILSVVSVSFYANGFSSTQPTAFYSGECWGGAEDCDPWSEITSCYFAEPQGQQKCYLNGPALTTCKDSPCHAANNKWFCSISEARSYAHTDLRTVTKSKWGIRVKKCYIWNEETEMSEFSYCDAEKDEGSSQEFTEALPCFNVVTCFTEADTCNVAASGMNVTCKNSGFKLDGSADNKVPHAEFPCGTEEDRLQEKKNCEKPEAEEDSEEPL